MFSRKARDLLADVTAPRFLLSLSLGEAGGRERGREDIHLPPVGKGRACPPAPEAPAQQRPLNGSWGAAGAAGAERADLCSKKSERC